MGGGEPEERNEWRSIMDRRGCHCPSRDADRGQGDTDARIEHGSHSMLARPLVAAAEWTTKTMRLIRVIKPTLHLSRLLINRSPAPISCGLNRIRVTLAAGA